MRGRHPSEGSAHLNESSALATERGSGTRAATAAAGSAAVDRIVGSCRALGDGDQVFDADGHVIAVFPSTPEGVVDAALYELHRGERRPLAAIVADPTEGRLNRGPLAANEGHHGNAGSNDDAAGAKAIGATRRQGPLGPISAYHAAIAQADTLPWCGAFASFCYERAGIASGDLGYSLNVPKRFAGSSAGGYVGQYYRMSGAVSSGERYGGALERGVHDARGTLADASPRYEHASVHSAMDLDIRPADAFWLEHTSKTGHVGLIIGVHKTPSLITLVTVEGNVSNKVDSKTRTIEVGANGVVSSQIKGWGRAAQLAAARAPALTGAMPSWMEDASKHRDKDDEASTR